MTLRYAFFLFFIRVIKYYVVFFLNVFYHYWMFIFKFSLHVSSIKSTILSINLHRCDNQKLPTDLTLFRYSTEKLYFFFFICSSQIEFYFWIFKLVIKFAFDNRTSSRFFFRTDRCTNDSDVRSNGFVNRLWKTLLE